MTSARVEPGAGCTTDQSVVTRNTQFRCACRALALDHSVVITSNASLMKATSGSLNSSLPLLRSQVHSGARHDQLGASPGQLKWHLSDSPSYGTCWNVIR